MSKTDRQRRPVRIRRRRAMGSDKQVRMRPDDRVDMILNGAVEFFAERGFKAQTRELARRIGVSQSLIYHYFHTKDDLIDRVYQRNFLSRWCGDFVLVFSDHNVPLDRRLKQFYCEYLRLIDDNDWIRIAMYSGLQDADLARRYVESQISELMRLIAVELALETGNAVDGQEPSEEQIELAWHLHSTFVYYVVRKHIFRTRTIADTDTLIDIVVDNFLAGAHACAAGRLAPIAPDGNHTRLTAGRFSPHLTQPHSRSA